jgi:hypothetical protein
VHSKSHRVDSQTSTPLFVSVIDFELWQRIHIGVDPPKIKAARGVDKKRDHDGRWTLCYFSLIGLGVFLSFFPYKNSGRVLSWARLSSDAL